MSQFESARIAMLSLVLVLLFVPIAASGEIWAEANSSHLARADSVFYRSLIADEGQLDLVLSSVAAATSADEPTKLELPMPDGTFQRFAVEYSPIMAPQLLRKFPGINTFRVRGIDDPATTGRLDMTPAGFHAMLSSASGTVFIDPDGSGGYRSYYKQRFVAAMHGMDMKPKFSCGASGGDGALNMFDQSPARFRTGDQLRTYRLALAATGEYTQFHGGTRASALAAIVTAVNRVNQIYNRDLAVQLELVANTDQLIYTDPLTDPYTNEDGAAMLDENQGVVDRIIGSANYDIGHVFSTGGGGVAFFGVCNDLQKAGGVTGLAAPIGDPFFIDFVAHEIGHQFHANHPFNGTSGACGGGNRVAARAYEPGSGTTIMSYAGICAEENLQANSDATFHGGSLAEIVEFIANGVGNTCGTPSATGNSAPVPKAGPDIEVPLNTPFVIVGSGNDPDGNTITYQWDELDAGAQTDAATLGTDLGDNALMRSFLPKREPGRMLPRLSELLRGLDANGSTTNKGETLPQAPRTMNFRLTARDGNGGVAEDDMQVRVTGTSGSFAITGGTLNDGGRVAGGSTQTLTWAAAGLGALCPRVAIDLLSFNNDTTRYCDGTDNATLNLGAFDNNGGANVVVPDLDVGRGRVRVACTNPATPYFNITSADLSVTGVGAATSDCREINEVASYGRLPSYDAATTELFMPVVDAGAQGVFSVRMRLVGVDSRYTPGYLFELLEVVPGNGIVTATYSGATGVAVVPQALVGERRYSAQITRVPDADGTRFAVSAFE